MKLDGNQASIREAIDAGLLAGAVTMVWRAGEVLQVNELGHRDVDAGLPMQRDTIFRIASMTKPVTVAAALSLVEEGKLALTDPVAKWLPELSDMAVLVDPQRPAGQDRTRASTDHDRRPDDAPQWPGVRVLGARPVEPRVRPDDVSPEPGPLAGRVGRTPVGASAGRTPDLQSRHRRTGHRAVANRGQAAFRRAVRADLRSAGDGRHRVLGERTGTPPRGHDVQARRGHARSRTT